MKYEGFDLGDIENLDDLVSLLGVAIAARWILQGGECAWCGTTQVTKITDFDELDEDDKGRLICIPCADWRDGSCGDPACCGPDPRGHCPEDEVL